MPLAILLRRIDLAAPLTADDCLAEAAATRATFTHCRDGRAREMTPPGVTRPSPAAQVAICLGYVHSRVWGATLVALAFILPSFLKVPEPVLIGAGAAAALIIFALRA